MYGKFYFLPQGLSPAPGMNVHVRELLRAMQTQLGLNLVDFVDDLIGVGDSCADAWRRLEGVLDFFTRIGVRTSRIPGGIRTPAKCTNCAVIQRSQKTKWGGHAKQILPDSLEKCIKVIICS